jgi:hypothetical protein
MLGTVRMLPCWAGLVSAAAVLVIITWGPPLQPPPFQQGTLDEPVQHSYLPQDAEAASKERRGIAAAATTSKKAKDVYVQHP